MSNYNIRMMGGNKVCTSMDYKYIFNPENGNFVRWGRTKDDDPDYSPYGPEIADIEITTICHGINGKPCPFCYKANTPNGTYMSFDAFKEIFRKLPDTLTQIAFGVDSRCESNPDVWKIMEHCRENGIVPNVTVAQITEKTADKLANLCGAVAVSRYSDSDACYDAVHMLTNRGMNQVNIHMMISNETLPTAKQTLIDRLFDKRLKDMYAIVFLSLKQRGRGVKYNPISQENFKRLVDGSMAAGIPFGFDSCSAPKFIKAIEGSKHFDQLSMCTEPCESSLFSTYINVDGIFYPCSFCEGHGEWLVGLDVLNCSNFMNDIWNHPKTVAFRSNLLDHTDDNNVRVCPIFNV